MTFDEAFDWLLGHEGGYSDHAKDPGGATMWGVTERVARANGYRGAMRVMPKSFAKQVYRRLYWDRVQADDLPAAVAFQMFDATVNHGPTQAIKFLQRAVKVADDGIIGPVTLRAVKDADPRDVVMLLNAQRLQFYTDLPTWHSFGKGWARRIAGNLRIATGGSK